jgi:hypothetical protein
MKSGSRRILAGKQNPAMQHVSLVTAENQTKTLCMRCKQQAADQFEDNRQRRMNQGRSSWTKELATKICGARDPCAGLGTVGHKEKSLPR